MSNKTQKPSDVTNIQTNEDRKHNTRNTNRRRTNKTEKERKRQRWRYEHDSSSSFALSSRVVGLVLFPSGQPSTACFTHRFEPKERPQGVIETCSTGTTNVQRNRGAKRRASAELYRQVEKRNSGQQARCEPPRAPTGRGDIYTENSPEGKRTSPPKKTAEGTPGSRTQRTTRRRTHTRPESHREETGEGRTAKGKTTAHGQQKKKSRQRNQADKKGKPRGAAETSQKRRERDKDKSES